MSKRWLLGIVAVLAMGSGPCAESQTPVASPATPVAQYSFGSAATGSNYEIVDDDREVIVDLDADQNGVPDDNNGDGRADEEKKVTVRNLVGCGISVMVARTMPNGAAINHSVFECLKRMGF